MEAVTPSGKFRYNGRIGVALIPTLIVLSGFGGKIPVGIGLVRHCKALKATKSPPVYLNMHIIHFRAVRRAQEPNHWFAGENSVYQIMNCMKVSLLVLFQVGAMVTYMLDAMRYREGALGAIWVTLGSVNLSIWVSGALFMGHRPFIMSFMIGICSGISLFITGSALGTSFPLPSTSLYLNLLSLHFEATCIEENAQLMKPTNRQCKPVYDCLQVCGLHCSSSLSNCSIQFCAWRWRRFCLPQPSQMQPWYNPGAS